jgi:hypothetical protein
MARQRRRQTAHHRRAVKLRPQTSGVRRSSDPVGNRSMTGHGARDDILAPCPRPPNAKRCCSSPESRCSVAASASFGQHAGKSTVTPRPAPRSRGSSRRSTPRTGGSRTRERTEASGAEVRASAAERSKSVIHRTDRSAQCPWQLHQRSSISTSPTHPPSSGYHASAPCSRSASSMIAKRTARSDHSRNFSACAASGRRWHASSPTG